jgi:redox-sensitive bicupin YhaK (pirin superfamily)
MDRGWTRGHMTCCMSDVPRDAPGYLELGRLMLAAVQEIDPRAGYPMHHHAGVETITIVLHGALRHDDSVGARGFTGPDDVGVVSAGSGIEHEEMAQDEPLRAVLFWIRSSTEHAPRFVKRTFPRASRRDRLVTVASGTGEPGSVPLRTDVTVRTGVLSAGTCVTHELRAGRTAYVLGTDAAFEINGEPAQAGDRVIASGGAGTLELRALGETELVVLDLDA